MKTFLIFSCLLATAAATNIDDYLNKVSEVWGDQITVCADENGFTNMTVQEIYQKEQMDGGANSTCFQHCLLKLVEISDNSTIDESKLKEYVDRLYGDGTDLAGKLKQAIDSCLPAGGDIQADKCKMTYDFVQCFLKNIETN